MWLAFRLWLLQLLGRDPRGIFRFWNGRRWCGVDPIPAARALMADPEFDWDKTPALTDDKNPEIVLDAVRVSANAARKAFGIPRIENGGLTESEACRVLWAFRAYLGDVKKNGSGRPISPEPTALDASAESATNAASASGSTGSESAGNEPGM